MNNKFAAQPLGGSIRRFIQNTQAELTERSKALAFFLENRMGPIMLAWLIIFGFGAALRSFFALSPIYSARDLAEITVPYLLIGFAPLIGYALASGSFPRGLLSAQPNIRLAFYGRWRKLDVVSARQHPLFGPTGFMASLLLGMLLNIPVRSFEFLMAVPAMNSHAPDWGTAIFQIMAFDAIAMNLLYMVCFIMALRSVPLFPRMLAFAWALDIGLQLTIAKQVAAIPDLPPQVAYALQDLLSGNIKKVVISAAIWLPYLLLSNRVNITFRQRIAVS